MSGEPSHVDSKPKVNLKYDIFILDGFLKLSLLTSSQ